MIRSPIERCGRTSAQVLFEKRARHFEDTGTIDTRGFGAASRLFPDVHPERPGHVIETVRLKNV
jgi:hypothetical protein